MPESVQKHHWTDPVITLAAGMGTFVLYCILVGTVIIQSLLALQWAKLDALFEETEAIVQESRVAIDRLNAQGFDHCDNDTLVAMQRELFLSSRIRDIGFVKDNVLMCTTGHGILSTPFAQQPWDFIGPSGLKYWSAVPMILFDNKITAPLMEKGQFNVVLDTRWLKQQAKPRDRQELLFRTTPSSSQYAYGA